MATPLTTPERSAGRYFRKQMEDRLSELPEPDIWVPALIRHYRHECPGYRDGTMGVSFDIAEQYILSPHYVVTGAGEVSQPDDFDCWVSCDPDCEIGPSHCWLAHEPSHKQGWHGHVPGGRFAFIYHEGRCARCGLTARSNQANRVVSTPDRSPSGKARQG